MGGTTWRELAFAGRVDEHRPGAVAVADALFAVDSLPFSGNLLLSTRQAYSTYVRFGSEPRSGLCGIPSSTSPSTITGPARSSTC
ncbi:hypothetical protein [Nocardia sp. NPDC004750]